MLEEQLGEITGLKFQVDGLVGQVGVLTGKLSRTTERNRNLEEDIAELKEAALEMGEERQFMQYDLNAADETAVASARQVQLLWDGQNALAAQLVRIGPLLLFF
jgi:hypothetical protein